jgi:hypothetical protein
MEVTVSNESNDPHWKELADYLKKLNVEFYWKTQNMISDKKNHHIQPPSRPVRRAGMGISMAVREEHTPSVLTGDSESDSSKKYENRGPKRTSS